jgi:hypothetical protein
VLFVLLGLFNHQEEVARLDMPVDDFEQLINTAGILSYHHQSAGKTSKFNEKDPAGQGSFDIRRPRETACSNNFRSEYKNSQRIYSDIMQLLLYKKGVFPHLQSEQEILS